MLRRFLLASLGLPLLAMTAYQKEIREWQAAREKSLRADTGWLTVAGLFWLKEGPNRFGSDASNDIVLPKSAPPRAGVFHFHSGKVAVEMDGKTRPLASDKSGKPDLVEMGPLTMFVIERGDRIGIRMRDRESSMRREFKGLHYFPVEEKYRVTGRFVAEPRKLPVANILGQTEPMDCPGYVVFHLNGHEARLYPVIEEAGAKEWFYIFRDETAGKQTYGAGRFLYAPVPLDGKVVIDFNKAYNPPCAFTPYATCPLPPKENRLPLRIEAGELKYGDH
jgi:uncharacterized protein (DUF1684 family)